MYSAAVRVAKAIGTLAGSVAVAALIFGVSFAFSLGVISLAGVVHGYFE